ncbi:MAG TPA: hypothetical protein VMK05_15180 [Burkholderiales bacterium]|nr:hypothetical protein [Burkholderiales bacterium]
MADKDGFETGASGEAWVEKIAVKGVIGIVLVMVLVTFAMAVNGIHQSDSEAAQLSSLQQPASQIGAAAASYFPDGYVNQAKEVEPQQPPTF